MCTVDRWLACEKPETLLAKRCSRNSRQARSISHDCESEPVDALAVLDALDLLALLHDPFIAVAQSLRCSKTKRRLCAMTTPRGTAVWGSLLRLVTPAAPLSVKSRRKAMQSVYEACRVEKTNAKNDIKTKTTAPTAPAASSETKKRRISPKLPGELCSDAHEASPARAGTLQKEMLLPLMTEAVSDAKADDASAAAEAAAASAAAEAADASATAEAAAAAAAKAGAGAELQCQSDLNPVAESEDKCRCRSSAGATDAEAAEYARVTAELRTELGRSMAMVQKLHSDVTAAKGNIAKAKRRLAALHDQNERSNRVCFMAMALCRRHGFEQELRELSDYIQKQRVTVRPFEHTG